MRSLNFAPCIRAQVGNNDFMRLSYEHCSTTANLCVIRVAALSGTVFIARGRRASQRSMVSRTKSILSFKRVK